MTRSSGKTLAKQYLYRFHVKQLLHSLVHLSTIPSFLCIKDADVRASRDVGDLRTLPNSSHSLAKDVEPRTLLR